MMTPRGRVEAALAGRPTDLIPYTIYEYKLPQCAVERQLRNDGLCIMNRRYVGYTSVTPNCKSESCTYTDEKTGKTLVRTVTRTPAGTFSTLTEPAGFTTWRHELPFKGPDDYPALIYEANDTQFIADYDAVIRAREWLGEDVYLRGAMPGYSPLQALIYTYGGRDLLLRVDAAARRAHEAVQGIA